MKMKQCKNIIITVESVSKIVRIRIVSGCVTVQSSRVVFFAVFLHSRV